MPENNFLNYTAELQTPNAQLCLSIMHNVASAVLRMTNWRQKNNELKDWRMADCNNYDLNHLQIVVMLLLATNYIPVVVNHLLMAFYTSNTRHNCRVSHLAFFQYIQGRQPWDDIFMRCFFALRRFFRCFWNWKKNHVMIFFNFKSVKKSKDKSRTRFSTPLKDNLLAVIPFFFFSSLTWPHGWLLLSRHVFSCPRQHTAIDLEKKFASRGLRVWHTPTPTHPNTHTHTVTHTHTRTHIHTRTQEGIKTQDTSFLDGINFFFMLNRFIRLVSTIASH